MLPLDTSPVFQLVKLGGTGAYPIFQFSVYCLSPCFGFRKDCSDDGVHPGIMQGIYGQASEGAFSVVLSGGYDDDVDLGDEL